eukprot:1159061-Pelagomonas_calceolata.AAC.7
MKAMPQHGSGSMRKASRSGSSLESCPCCRSTMHTAKSCHSFVDQAQKGGFKERQSAWLPMMTLASAPITATASWSISNKK